MQGGPGEGFLEGPFYLSISFSYGVIFITIKFYLTRNYPYQQARWRKSILVCD